MAEVQTTREIKFPLIACILAEDRRQPEGQGIGSGTGLNRSTGVALVYRSEATAQRHQIMAACYLRL